MSTTPRTVVPPVRPIVAFFVCVCVDGQHGIEERASRPYARQDDADRTRLYVAASHVVRAERRVIDELTEVPS